MTRTDCNDKEHFIMFPCLGYCSLVLNIQWLHGSTFGKTNSMALKWVVSSLTVK